MREIMAYGVERTLAVIGWTALSFASLLIGLSVLWHLDYSPFTHPGATPDDNRLGLLSLDGMRWCAIVVGCAAAAMKSTPHSGDQVAHWLVPPIIVLIVTAVMAVGATVGWLAWMNRLPGGDLSENIAFAVIYFGIPVALIISAGIHLRRPMRVRTQPPRGKAGPRPAASSNKGRTARRR